MRTRARWLQTPRLALLLLAGCVSGVHAGSSTVAAPGPAPPRLLPAPPPATRNARVELPGGPDPRSWFDITVSGEEARSHQICEWLVDRRMTLQRVQPALRVSHPCSARRLAPIPARVGAYLLVTTESLDRSAFVAEGMPAAVTVTSYLRFASAEDCERARADLQAARAYDDAETETRVRDFLAKQLEVAREREARACREASDATTACAAEPASERPRCELNAQHLGRGCEMERTQARLLARRQAARPTPDRADCRPE